jgi:biopolymer transport protein ExbD
MKTFLRRKAPSLGIDITSLMDIVFQLLLFFILTSAMLQPSLPLELPGSSQEQSGTEADLVISVDAAGQVYFNDVPTDREALEPALRGFVSENPDGAVILRGDKQAGYGDFFTVLDIARNVGVRTLHLAYEER